MQEKKLKKSIIGKNILSNILLALKILFDLIPQVLIVYFINLLIKNGVNTKKFNFVFITVFISYILKGVFYYFGTKVAHDKAYEKLAEIRLKIINHMKKLNLGFFKEHNTKKLTNIVQHDVEQVEIYLAHGLPEIISATFLPILIFITMLFLDWRLALIMIAGVPLMFFVKILSAKTMKEKFQLYFNKEMQMREELMEYVRNIAVIKAFAKEEKFSEKTLKTAKSYVYDLKKSMSSVTVPMGLIDVFMEFGVVFVMILGSIFLSDGEITVSKFILSIILSSMFISAISKTATLQHFFIVFKESLKSIGKILCIEILNNKQNKELKSGDIIFKNVCFEYERDGFSLKNINLTLKQNTLNAFVGTSGSGKSTLANLLMGFWDLSDGEIYIDGKDISNYKQENISALIGSVQQETVLFNLSVLENIAIGKVGATKEEVVEAAKKARCHDFIIELCRGYDTKVGEMGVKLSEGEKQRITIARMILKDAPILVLDEAMASVDSENEKLIEEAIEELRKNKTVITIAHHLNTIINSDQIIVMDKGCNF